MRRTIVDARLNVAPEMALGHYTHEKNPFTATAALTTLAIIAEEGLVENARRQGERTLARLRVLAGRHAMVREVRGVGLLLAMALRGDGGARCRQHCPERCFSLSGGWAEHHRRGG